jgi:hypothetical protein
MTKADTFHGVTVHQQGGKSVFAHNNHGPFANTTAGGGTPVRRPLKHIHDRITVERYQDKLYIDLDLSRSYEKSHDHLQGRLVLDLDQIALLKRIIDGEAR